MNLKRIVSLTTVLALALVAAVQAIDTRSTKPSDKNTVAAKKPCCAKGVKSASAKTVAAKKPCCAKGVKSASAKTVAGKSPCAAKCGQGRSASKTVAAVLDSLPRMSYQVGDFQTGCFMSATAKAEAKKADVKFVVEDKVFADRGEATVALAALLDEQAAEMSEVQFLAGKKCFKCPVSAKRVADKAKTRIKYRLAGFDFDSEKKATLVAEKVAKAIADVKMTYKADGKVVGCPSSCKGKKVTYVIGDDETPCAQSAKLLLAEHKIRTIVETAAAAL